MEPRERAEGVVRLWRRGKTIAETDARDLTELIIKEIDEAIAEAKAEWEDDKDF